MKGAQQGGLVKHYDSSSICHAFIQIMMPHIARPLVHWLKRDLGAFCSKVCSNIGHSGSNKNTPITFPSATSREPHLCGFPSEILNTGFSRAVVPEPLRWESQHLA